MASMTASVREGTVPFSHPSLPKPCETWYKVVGDLKQSSTLRPLVTLHGGPGACHNYLLPLAALSTKYGVPIVFYDQLGNGKSSHIREKRLDTGFWTPDLLMAELDNLLEHLGIADEYDLLGQSWGGMFASMWAIRGHKGLNRIVISNSPASMVLWVEACNELRKNLPKDVEDKLVKHERDRTYDDPEYEEAVTFFYKRHLCRLHDGDGFPKDVTDSLNWIKEDDTVYMTMNGPSEFTIIGSLKSWTVEGEVHNITVPVLLINGEHDEAQDVCVQPFFAGIPKVKWITMQGTSHMSHIEEPEKYMKIVLDFLRMP